MEVVLTPTEAGAAEGVAADRVAFDYDRAGMLTAEQGAQGRFVTGAMRWATRRA